MTLKKRLKMTNRPSPTHLLKYATHKICLSIITDLSNI